MKTLVGKPWGEHEQQIHYESKSLQYTVTLTASQVPYPKFQEYKKRLTVFYQTFVSLQWTKPTATMLYWSSFKMIRRSSLIFYGFSKPLAFVADSKKKLTQWTLFSSSFFFDFLFRFLFSIRFSIQNYIRT